VETIENRLIDKVMTTTAANDQSFLKESFLARFSFFLL